jgi:hypothetical protein
LGDDAWGHDLFVKTSEQGHPYRMQWFTVFGANVKDVDVQVPYTIILNAIEILFLFTSAIIDPKIVSVFAVEMK